MNNEFVVNHKKDIVFMFSGQGSQYYGMAYNLYKENVIFKEWMDRLDAYITQKYKLSIIEELYYSGKTMLDTFDRLVYSSSAIFMIEYSLYQLLNQLDIKPAYILGESMGLFTCLTIAGAMEPEVMIDFIINEAYVFEEKCEKGGMIAILDDYRIYRNFSCLYNNSELVSINAENHFIVSGKEAGIQIIKDFLIANKIAYFKLPVLYAFHSNHIDAAAKEYKKIADMLLLPDSLKIKILGIKDERIINSCISEFLWEVVRGKVKTAEILAGIKEAEEIVLVDLGPSGTLANIAKKIVNPKVNIFSIITPFQGEIKNLKNLKAFFANYNY